MTTAAGSGHPTTCLSMAELMSCLFFNEMKYRVKRPHDFNNDELVLSEGHAAPILWSCYAEAGIIPQDDLMNLRKVNSVLEGHPTPRMPWIKVSTGSLGQGLSAGVGMALAMRLGKSQGNVYVMMGDGECAEGNVWEAANSAAYFGLKNICAIVNVNRLGQSQQTMHGHDLYVYVKKFRAFGWEAIEIDGHDIDEILIALKKARQSKKPFAIIARTVKGKGISFLENKNGWHGVPLKKPDLAAALEELGEMPEVVSKKYVKFRKSSNLKLKKDFRLEKSKYHKHDMVATRDAYGKALVSLGKINKAVVSVDGDVKNSTRAESFFEKYPERSFEGYIAEQNMVGMAAGMASKGYMPFTATFAAFLTRAHDQIRMAGHSFLNMKFCGSHVGVSIGQDGPSQMGLEDIAMFRPIPECVIFYPCDANSTEECVKEMAKYEGMVYLRTTRPKTPIVYGRGERFPIGGSKVLKKSAHDKATVVCAGITVFEALKAYDELKKEGIKIRVIDAYSVKPIDAKTLKRAGKETGRVIVVEDHFEGGLGDAVADVVDNVVRLCVRKFPRSGKPAELMKKYGIDYKAIMKEVKR
jgi:transketolase